MLPVFLLILSGLLDFGFMLYSRMTVISAAREGARAALNVQAKNAAEFATIPTIVVPARVNKVIEGTGLTGSLATATTCVKAPPAPPHPATSRGPRRW